MYKYLLWDIDGTILDFKASEKISIKRLFERFKLGVCTDEMLADYSSINVRYWELLERGEKTKPEILVGRFIEFFSKYGLDISLAGAFDHDYQIELGKCPVFTKNAKDVLAACQGKYRQIGVTNGTKVAQTGKLETSGLIKILDAVYISEDLGVEKPHVEFFEHVFKSEGIADRNTALIIGDSLTSDMQGGINYGIDTCWFNPQHKENKKNLQITYEVDDLQKILNILAARG
ncbi:MAG: YjjG family noncanonical pyrimidine nucleotidase [Phascolarctobacterium sp.]|nr:YjjG family noncanonical pyrimidine nucleotidase [Phascolarctobacterium sp.]